MVEAALQGMKERRPSFWERPDVRTALMGVPGAAQSVQAEDTRIVITSLLGMLGNLPMPSQFQFVDATAKPDFARISRYWSLSSGYLLRDAKGLFGVSRMANPQP